MYIYIVIIRTLSLLFKCIKSYFYNKKIKDIKVLKLINILL